LTARRLEATESAGFEQRPGFVLETTALSAQAAFEEAVTCLREGLASQRTMAPEALTIARPATTSRY